MTTLLQILAGLGIVQGLFISIVLVWYPATNRLLSRMLAIVLFLTVLLMFSEFIDLLDLSKAFDPIILYATLLDLLLVVAIYFLTLVIVGKKQHFLKADLWHLLPFALGILWFETGFHQYGIGVPGSFSHIPDNVAVLVGYKGLVWALYMGLSLRIAYSRRPDEDLFTRGIRNRLLRHLLWPFLAISAISYLAFWAMYFGMKMPIDSDYMGVLLIVAFVYFLTFIILREPGQFIGIRAMRARPKYYRSGIDANQMAQYQDRLRQFVEVEKPFLNEQLSLTDLAGYLQLSPNSLSQVINEGLGKSFNDFLNEYRLDEVKQKLLDPAEDKKTILALAFESGFQSKASFNRVFKKAEGMTPSQFRDANRSHRSR